MNLITTFSFIAAGKSLIIIICDLHKSSPYIYRQNCSFNWEGFMQNTQRVDIPCDYLQLTINLISTHALRQVRFCNLHKSWVQNKIMYLVTGLKMV